VSLLCRITRHETPAKANRPERTARHQVPMPAPSKMLGPGRRMEERAAELTLAAGKHVRARSALPHILAADRHVRASTPRAHLEE
jgi:hypothetical protein